MLGRETISSVPEIPHVRCLEVSLSYSLNIRQEDKELKRALESGANKDLSLVAGEEEGPVDLSSFDGERVTSF